MRCHSCAAKKRHKKGLFGFQKGTHSSFETEFKKGDTPWIKGKKRAKESIEQMKRNMPEDVSIRPIKHHIWYEDNEGNSTEKGVMIVTRKHHPEIHGVLNKNKWTDNRRYLAG